MEPSGRGRAGYRGVAKKISFEDAPDGFANSAGGGGCDGGGILFSDVSTPTGNANILCSSSWTASDDAMDRTDARRQSLCMSGDCGNEAADELDDEEGK